MNRDLWNRITDTFDTALDYPPNERDSYLDRVCAGDQALRAEVVRLLSEFEKVDHFLEPIASLGQVMAVGELISGRYRIESLLGRGGMGEVYRVHDELLNEQVALKTLRPELNDYPGGLRRFQREVLLARRVTHPNVCRVFDVGVHKMDVQIVHFFTMQLLDGETLSAFIRRTGAIPKDEAYKLVIQMTEGLDAAHQAGIVHRDFKSANVMLCDGKAVITDFGLARFDAATTIVSGDTKGSITGSAQVAGTVAYMSPEQLSGEKITAASDIYSLGVVLFEMATGRLPFDDQHIIQSAMQRASDPAPDVRAMAPEIELHWAFVISRCLQRNPEKRFTKASDVASKLRYNAWRPPMVYWTRRKWMKVAGGAVATGGGMALIAGAFRFSSQNVKLSQGAEVLLAPITNSTGDSRFDAITELFRSQLSQSVHLNLIEGDKLGGALKQMGKSEDATEPTAVREAAWRMNAALSIFGNVSRVGPDFALNIQLETRGSQPDIPHAKSLRSFSASDPAALMHSVRDASTWVRETIGESAGSIASFDRLPENATTPSWEALALYARGQQFFMKQDFEPAILEFEAALRVDPKFTLAAFRRADLLVSQHRQGEGFAQWQQGIKMLGERSVTRAEELYARGMSSSDTGNYDDADRYFRTWSVEYPFDWKAPFYRMLPLVMNGYAFQALELLKQVRDTMPEYGDVYAMMIGVCLVLGQTKEARDLVPQVRKRGRPERADLKQAQILFREGDCGGCIEILRTVQRSKYLRGRVDAMFYEALLLIDAGLPEAAAANVENFLRSGSENEVAALEIDLRIVQAWAEMLAGKRQKAVDHACQALDLQTGPMILTLCGSIFARTGASDLSNKALKLCDQYQDLPVYRLALHRIIAEQAKAKDQNDVAEREFRIAASSEPRIAHRQYLIEVLPLSSPERLQLSLNVARIPWQYLRPPSLYCLGSLNIALPLVNAAYGETEPFVQLFLNSSRKLEKLA